MKKLTVFFLSLGVLLLCAGCGGKGMQAEAWLDYYNDDMPWESATIILHGTAIRSGWWNRSIWGRKFPGGRWRWCQTGKGTSSW